VAEERTVQFHKNYMALWRRLVQERTRCNNAELAESAQKKAKHEKEEKGSAGAASSKRKAKPSEEPDGEVPWDTDPIRP
jgi:hypothetical protein